MARLNRSGDRVLCDDHIRCGGELGHVTEPRQGRRVYFLPAGWQLGADGVWAQGKEAADRLAHGRHPVRIPKGRTSTKTVLRSPDTLPILVRCPGALCGNKQQPIERDVIRADVQPHSEETGTTVVYWRNRDPAERK